MIDALQQTVVLDGRNLLVHASVGSVWTDAFIDREELLRRADVAMYSAKAQGKNRSVVWQDGLDEHSDRWAGLAGDLKAAIDDSGLELHYQPIVEPSGAVVAAEALLRWPHHRWMVSPTEVVAVAEQQGLMFELTCWVIDRACADRARWPGPTTGPDIARISINVSPTDLERPAIVDVIGSACARHGLDPSAIQIEVTESALSTDRSELVRQLRHLRRLDVSVAVDDFGAGYSSLGRLGSIPADILKIDRSFVARLHHGDRDRLVVRSIVELAGGFGLRTVAEGVETARQAEILTELGVDQMQGYFFGRPGPATALTVTGPRTTA